MKKLSFVVLILLSFALFACNVSQKTKKTDKPVASEEKIPPNTVAVEALVTDINNGQVELEIKQIKQRGQGYNAPLKNGDKIIAHTLITGIEKGQTYYMHIKATEQIGNTFKYTITKIK